MATGNPRHASDSTLPGLFVDLYELTMAQVYVEEGMEERATFSLFARELPPERRFLLVAGLDAALTWLECMCFTESDLAYLDSLGRFSPAFLEWLAGFRVTADVYAMREGTPAFANEPLLEVEAPIAEAQLLETVLLNQVTFATLMASKGIRVTFAAGERPVIDFGTRRSHGADAALTAARSLYLAGFAGTSNVEAGRRYGIPVTGTMAHSYVQARASEPDAFRTFVRHFPETVLLVDTYDTLTGVRHVTDLARELGEQFRVRAIRLDSGDVGGLAREARTILDAAGLSQVEIVASGGLDEFGVAALRASGAPIDSYAVGTRVNVAADAPALETVYKLVSYAGRGRRKLSTGKATLPHRKQVFRRFDDGVAAGDVIARHDETLEGEALLAPVMRNGKRVEAGRAGLGEARRHAAEQVARLPESLRALDPGNAGYPVTLSPALAMEDGEAD